MARDVMLARHTGSRLHVAHVSTAGTVEVLRWAKAQGIAVTAEVTPHHLATDHRPAARLRPGLQGQPAAAAGRGRRGAAGGTGGRHDRRRRHRPRAACQARQGARVRRRGVRDDRPGGRARGRRRVPGAPRPAGLGGRRAGAVADPRADRRPGRPRRSRSRPASPPTWSSSTPTRPSSSTPRRRSRARATTPGTAARSTAPSTRPTCAVCARHTGVGPSRRSTSDQPARRPRPGGPRPRGRARLPRRGVRRAGRDRRGGGVLHGHDRLPGDPHRPQLPPPGRRHDRTARGQHGDQHRGRRVGAHLGRRLRRTRPGAAALELAGRPARWRTSCASRTWSGSAVSTPGP